RSRQRPGVGAGRVRATRQGGRRPRRGERFGRADTCLYGERGKKSSQWRYGVMTARSGSTLAAFAILAGSAAAQPKASTKAPEGGTTAAPKKRQRVVSDLSGFELLDPEKLKDKP